ncbi:MAG: hypothetical protein WBM13_05150 [Bacteroidia bacterium]
MNHLIFDSSISLNDIEKLNITNNSLKFEIERRTLENVTRHKKIGGTVTLLSGMTSSLCFENISDLTVFGLTEQFKHNHFVDGLNLDKDGKLSLTTVYGFCVKMNVSEKTRIVLRDIKKSEFGKGRIVGKSGFTSDEWTNFLNEKKYNPI